MLVQKRYAQAMLAHPKENWGALLQQLSQIAATKEMQAIYGNPFITSNKTERIVLDLLPGLSKKQENLVKALVHHKRLGFIEEILCAYDQLSLQAQNKHIANICTAEKATAAQKKKIEAFTERAFPQIKSFVFRYAIDKSLIGGFVVNIDNQIINASVRDRLETLSRDLGGK